VVARSPYRKRGVLQNCLAAQNFLALQNLLQLWRFKEVKEGHELDIV
jgi:hypothetical protein